MSRPRSHGLPSTTICTWIVIAMLAMIIVPAVITLETVRQPIPIMPVDQNATPHGYTLSLLLFIIPSVTIAGWFLPGEDLHLPRRAFFLSLAFLVPIGWLLDFVFAQWFFTYPNLGATLRLDAPALGHPVPLEEYVFYLTGFLTVLLLYVWLGEFWLAAYNVEDYPAEAGKVIRLLKFHPMSLLLAAVLIGAAWFYKKHLALPTDQPGFPGYFAFLIAGAFLPSVCFFPIARRFINWRALSLTLFFMLLVSLLWEATLAVPYHWWGFQHRQMLGIFIGAWSGLPLEEVLLWIAVTYATAIVFEVLKVWVASQGPQNGPHHPDVTAR